jgi:hypothetical protein
VLFHPGDETSVAARIYKPQQMATANSGLNSINSTNLQFPVGIFCKKWLKYPQVGRKFLAGELSNVLRLRVKEGS